MEIIEDNNYWEDPNNNNKLSKSLYKEKEAKKILLNLKKNGNFNNTNCTNLISSRSCFNTHHSINCISLKNSSFCISCEDSKDIYNKSNIVNNKYV